MQIFIPLNLNKMKTFTIQSHPIFQKATGYRLLAVSIYQKHICSTGVTFVFVKEGQGGSSLQYQGSMRKVIFLFEKNFKNHLKLQVQENQSIKEFFIKNYSSKSREKSLNQGTI